MLAFIEGAMERQFVNVNFKYIRVVPVHNGVAWSVDQLCNQITTAYRALDQNVETLVWLDREKRQESAIEIRAAIKSSLEDAGADPNSIHIIVNDRMTENIILADTDVIKSVFGDDSYLYSYEGRHGKGILKDMYKEIGINYKEMIHGVQLLKKIRIREAVKNSPSLIDFSNSFIRSCWWVDERG